MAVLAEALSVIVPVHVLACRYPGGLAAYEKAVPNETWCTDGRLTRVGFMTPDSVGAWIDSLERKGLVFVLEGEAVDIVVVEQQTGPTCPCSWLQFVTWPNGVAAALSSDEDAGACTVVAPPGWTEEQSRGMVRIPLDQIDDRFEPAGEKEPGFRELRNRETGETAFVADPFRSALSPNGRLVEIVNEALSLARQLPTARTEPVSSEQKAAMQREAEEMFGGGLVVLMTTRDEIFQALRELETECGRLRHAMGVDLGLNDFARGVCTRVRGDYAAAEMLFARAAGVRPRDVELQLELCLCAGKLGARDRALAAAQRGVALDATSEATWGNLAASLMDLGRREEARAAVERALAIDPDNAINRTIEARLKRLS